MTETGLTIRRIPLEFPPDVSPILIAGQPEQSYVNVGLSLLLPYLEPYLIRSMRAAKGQVQDPKLLADLEAFCGQEGQHYRQHMRFNEAMRLGATADLERLESELDADYQRFTESKSLRFNLAFAEGFEAYTTAVARFSLETGMLERLLPVARDLFQWHLVEELEHRTVAFDVYNHLFGDYLFRFFVGLFAQWHLNRFILRVMAVMRNLDREAFRREFGGAAEARGRLFPWIGQMLRSLLPKLLATYLPWYTPHRIAMPAKAQALADHYAALSASNTEERLSR